MSFFYFNCLSIGILRGFHSTLLPPSLFSSLTFRRPYILSWASSSSFREAIQYVLCLPQLRQRDIRSGLFSFPFGLILFSFLFPSFFFISPFRHWDDCYVNCGRGHFADCRLKGGGERGEKLGRMGKQERRVQRTGNHTAGWNDDRLCAGPVRRLIVCRCAQTFDVAGSASVRLLLPVIKWLI